MIPRLDDEAWLVKRLAEHGTTVFAGDTDVASRREHVRAAIRRAGLAVVIAGKHNGKPETYEQAFVRIYRQPLGSAAIGETP